MCGILAILLLKGDLGPGSAPADGRSVGGWEDGAEWWMRNRGPDGQSEERRHIGEEGGLLLRASLLQVRGGAKLGGPQLADGLGNVLCFNGEIYSGLSELGQGVNDGAALLSELGASPEGGAAGVFSRLRGPWAAIFWEEGTQTLWYGRDVIGRRSLLRFKGDDRLVLSSVSLSPFDAPEEVRSAWEEVPPGIYSVSLASAVGSNAVPEPLHHEWVDPIPAALAQRGKEEPSSGPGPTEGGLDVMASAEHLLRLLRNSVKLRCSLVDHRYDHSQGVGDLPQAKVAVLYSGGLDSAILAALAGEAVEGPIDLINVCFVGGKSPDRLAALEGLRDLSESGREYRLVEVDSTLQEVDAMRSRLLQLLQPTETIMDLNIGASLSIAARCKGRLKRFQDGGIVTVSEDYTSAARVILCGQGADEQCGGYGRHKTKFQNGGWPALSKEIEHDVNRLWRRNLGRDDRVISDQGREARFPFLDEDVALSLHKMAVEVKCDPLKPLGEGDKQVLRVMAKNFLPGLARASQRPKRAIQFGTRIAKLANARDFGSNRAANMASAGSVVLPEFDAVGR
ncbi:asparagine synthetase domain-containing protein [Chloropicon primus]|uniref:Asparagine synthetase domain-containing protein n=1 Tax=Chloropicon primus TaxID=1764295 RepID=A0A5B8MT95_9CHLO|nr:asparagine synthetase domain-containing protein [Chloropicon primus]|eukprot:QDZ22640.1 asparagine synthetase domain-containing protein [Chloropicon primus]